MSLQGAAVTSRDVRSALLLALLLSLGSVPASAAEPSSVAAGGSDWWSGVRRDLAGEEYQVSWQESTDLADLPAAWQAPNRAHGFRTYFTGSGIRVVPRTADASTWEWSLTLLGYGRPGAIESVEPAAPRSERNRLEYDRRNIVEWYVNDERGLEQGFTLASPPPPVEGGSADSDRARVEIVLGLEGSLSAHLSQDGQAVDFSTQSGAPTIHYAALAVRDALGKELPAHFEAFTGPGSSVASGSCSKTATPCIRSR